MKKSEQPQAKSDRQIKLDEVFKRVGGLYKERGWFFDAEVRAQYRMWGSMSASQDIRRRLDFAEYSCRIPGTDKLFHLFASDITHAKIALQELIIHADYT